MSASAVKEREGVYKDEATGKWFIAPTRRPDGTWRKARPVKDGYIPPEEMPAFETRSMAFHKSAKNYIPGLGYQDEQPKPETANMSKSAKRNQKRKESRKAKREEEESEQMQHVLSVIQQSNSAKPIAPAAKKKTKAEPASATEGVSNNRGNAGGCEGDSTAEGATAGSGEASSSNKPVVQNDSSLKRFSDPAVQKRYRYLRKKINAIEVLEERLAKGDNLNSEQMEKISKKGELQSEMDEIELSESLASI